MEKSLVICLYLLLTIFAIISIKRIICYNYQTALCGSAMLFGILVYYCIVPLIIFFSENVKDNSGFIYRVQNATDYQLFNSFFLIILFLGSFLISYYNKRHRFNDNNKIFNIFYKIDKRLFLLTFTIGGLSLILYIYSFGSITQLLFYAEYLRSFATSATDIVSYEASILVVPARLVTVTPLLILPLYSYFRNNSILICLYISIFLAGIFLLANAGRTYIISFALMFGVPILMRKIKHPWLFTIAVGFLGLQLLDVLDTLFVYLKTDVWIQEESNLIRYLEQFSYPISNVINASGIVDANNGFRFGQDFITGLLNIIPGINFPTSIEPTSYFYGGSNWHVSGGVPNDIITFGYLEFGYLGPIFMGLLLGYITNRSDQILLMFNHNYGFNVFKCAIIVCSCLYIVNADIISLVRNQMQTTCLYFCVLYTYYSYRLGVQNRNCSRTLDNIKCWGDKR